MAKRVGFFSHDFHPPKGGQGRNFSELFQHLYKKSNQEEGFEFFAFSPCRNTLPNHIRLFWFIEDLPLAFAQTLFFILLNFTLNRLVKRHNLDLVVLNGGPGGSFLFWKPRVPVVYVANHTYSQQSRFIPSQKWKQIFFTLEKRSYSFAKHLLPISSTTKDELISEYGIPEEKITIIPVGIDTERFKPLNTEKLPKSIFFLGRLEYRKGIHFLVQAMPLIKKTIPEVMLFIGGRGKLKSSLEEQVLNLDLKGNVKFLGEIPEEELPLWYNRSEILIVPSVFEGLGISVLEGMACGTPVIGTYVPGIRDSIEEGKSGLLVPYGYLQVLADKAILLFSNQEKYLELRENGLERARQKFSWEKITEMYFEIIKKC